MVVQAVIVVSLDSKRWLGIVGAHIGFSAQFHNGIVHAILGRSSHPDTEDQSDQEESRGYGHCSETNADCADILCVDGSSVGSCLDA